MEVTSAGGVNENLPQKFMNIIHEKKNHQSSNNKRSRNKSSLRRVSEFVQTNFSLALLQGDES